VFEILYFLLHTNKDKWYDEGELTFTDKWNSMLIGEVNNVSNVIRAARIPDKPECRLRCHGGVSILC
jgi:hypothetical protein